MSVPDVDMSPVFLFRTLTAQIDRDIPRTASLLSMVIFTA
jgi:hypothetical protein